jgi:ceramide glucosyltransferase
MPQIADAITILFALLALASFGTLLWQWALAVRFPLHRRDPAPDFHPPLTVLKPLKGCEPDTETCLRSWFEQEYPGPIQYLFGVARADDPVCDLVRRLMAQYPDREAQLAVCGETLGANAKVSTLIQLERAARHELVVISDADVRIERDFLTSLVAPLQDAGVGLVNCLYALANPSNAAMGWEAVAINADFWSQVLQSQSLTPLDYALGAVMATRRECLEKIGGFTVLADYLADDYQLGNRVFRAGYRVVLSPLVAECWSAPMSWRQVWDHQLRWARTIRISKPVPYALSIIGNPTVWPLGWLLAVRTPEAGLIVLAALTVRMVLGQHLQRRLLQHWPPQPQMVVVKDLLNLAIWLCSWIGHEVLWRGTRFRILPGGRLLPLPAAKTDAPSRQAKPA